MTDNGIDFARPAEILTARFDNRTDAENENALNKGSLVMTIRAHADDSGAVRAVLGVHFVDGATP